MKTYRRRKYFIDRRYQTKYIFLTIMLLISYTLTLMTMIFIPYVIDLASGGPLAQQAEAARTLLDLHGRIWPGVFSAILLFSVLSVYISHQVAGPVYRIKKGIMAMVEGDLRTKITLRRRDDLKDLLECTDLLRDELLAILSALRDDQALLVDCRRALEDGQDGAEEIVQRLKAGIARNEEIVGKFKTP